MVGESKSGNKKHLSESDGSSDDDEKWIPRDTFWNDRQWGILMDWMRSGREKEDSR